MIMESFNLLTDVGLYVDSSKILSDCDKHINSSMTNNLDESIVCSNGENYTSGALESSKTDLRILHITLAGFFILGGLLFLSQLFIYYMYLRASKSPSFEHNVDESSFLKHFYKIHGLILGVESIIHDLPVGFIAIELCVLVWQQPNCWECVNILSTASPAEVSLEKTNLWLGIKISSLVPVTLYKGK